MQIQIKVKGCDLNLNGDYLEVTGVPTKDAFEVLRNALMQKNIKRFIFKMNRDISYDPVECGFKRISAFEFKDGGTNKYIRKYINNVYQFYNPAGIYFENNGYQKCSECGKWFKITDEEIQYIQEKNWIVPRVCKVCKGYKVKKSFA